MAFRMNKNRLREIRKEKRLSGVDMQVLSGVPFSRIYYIERGTHIPTNGQKEAIARALGCPIETVFPKELEHSDEIVVDR